MIGRLVQVLVVLVVFGVLVRVWLEVGRRRMGRPLPEPLPLGRRTNWQEGRQILIYGRLGAGKTALAMQRLGNAARARRISPWRSPSWRRRARRTGNPVPETTPNCPRRATARASRQLDTPTPMPP